MTAQPSSPAHRRADLPPLERAVSDTLDEYLVRMHGIMSSWAHPDYFLEWLGKRGYTVVAAEGHPDGQ